MEGNERKEYKEKYKDRIVLIVALTPKGIAVKLDSAIKPHDSAAVILVAEETIRKFKADYLKKFLLKIDSQGDF